MEQKEIPILGDVIGPMHRHPPAELLACKRKFQACRLSVSHSGFPQDVIAERIGVTAGYLSMLLSGKRRWTDDLQYKFERVTRSWAPFQWEAMKRGVGLHFDEINIMRATGQYLVDHAQEAIAA